MDILVVEDNKQTHDALISLFKRMGHTPRGALCSRDALRELDKCIPQIILTDWDLDESLSGIDIATYALDKCEECVVMFYTGNSVQLLKQQTSHLNVHRYFKKPISLRELRRECEAVFKSCS